MATSGWQNEQTWFTYSSNIRLIGNIYISSITHSGSSLRVQGKISAGARGSNNYSFYYSDYTSYAQPEGGSKIALGSKGKTWKVGQSDTVVNFDVTLSNVSASTTSKSFSVNFYGPNTNSVKATLKWTLSFSASGSAPSGAYVSSLSSKWNSFTGTYGIASNGGLSLSNLELKILRSAYAAGVPAYQYNAASGKDIGPFTVEINNGSETANNPTWQIRGCGYYYSGVYAKNSAGEIRFQGPSIYTPPAPCSLTYTDPGGEGTKVYPVVFSGDTTKNHTSYDTAELKRTVRYKVEGASSWTYAANNVEALVGAQTSFNISVPGGKSATIEGWMTYHGLQSEVKTVTIYNGNPPSRVYGSVDGQSKLCNKLYGSVGGTSVEIVKLYASVNGKSKSILG